MAIAATSADTPTRLDTLCEGVIEAGWLACLAVVPLLFDPYSMHSFEPAKTSALRSLVLVMIAAWLLKVVPGGRPWRAGMRADNPPSPSRSRRSMIATGLALPLIVPSAALCASLLLSTTLSLDARLSVWGSGPRSQGLITELAYVAAFALVLAHLRTRAQWLRLLYVVLATSTPVALYAILQAVGRDPIPWPDSLSRAASTLGNPMFLGAYLAMVLLFTVGELVHRLSTPSTTGSRRAHTWLIAAAAALQLVAFALASSRGPLLGLLAGGLVGVAAFLPVLVARWRRSHAVVRWLGIVLVASATAGLIMVSWVSVTGSAHQGDAFDSTGMSRLLQTLDLRSATARTRAQMWSGTVELLSGQRPLRPAHGPPDRLHRLRPVVGYGPETFPLAFSRFFSPEQQELERPDTVPDRAHNRLLDVLVTTGLVGAACWLLLYGSVCYWACRWLGLLPTARRRLIFPVMLVGGACLGAAAPPLIAGSAALSAVGLTGGAVAALILWIAVCSIHGRVHFGRRETLIVALLALVVAHLVDSQFSLAVAETSIVLWVMLAVLVSAGLGWLDTDDDPAHRRPPGNSARSRRREAWIAALVMAPGMLTLIYGFLANWGQEASMWSVLRAAFARNDPRGVGTCVMLAGSWLGGLVLVPLLQQRRGRGPGGARRRSLITASLAAPIGYSLVKAGALASTVRNGAVPGVDVLTLSESIARHFPVYTWCVLLVVIAGGVAIGRTPARQHQVTRARIAILAGCTVVLAVAVTTLVAVLNLAPIRADTLLKHGQRLADAGRPVPALTILERAAELVPDDPMVHLAIGRAAMTAARRSEADGDRRQALLERAEHALIMARSLAPHEPDHTANVARCLVVQAANSRDAIAVEELRERAAEEYDEALRLRPTWRRVQHEYAALLEAMGRAEEASQLRATASTAQ